LAGALALAGVGCLVVWSNQPSETVTTVTPQATSTPSATSPQATTTPQATPLPTVSATTGAQPSKSPRQPQTTTVALPVRLTIPAIGVSTALVRLGLQPDRTVEVPADPELAGWFDLGTAPGATGSSVILGHVDSTSGPAVFHRLKELQPGQRLTVGGADGSAVDFEVIDVATYPNESFPAQKVYATQGGKLLNLVTCGGVYDSSNGGYQSNVVVYTRMADTSAQPG